MKPKSLLALFLISLAVNFGLALCLFRKAPAPPGRAGEESIPDPGTRPAPPAEVYRSSAATPSENLRLTWQSLESSDYKQYAANLRAIGCPEATIRDILRADITQLYEARKKQLRREAPKFEYWRNEQDFLPGIGREAWTGMLALDGERDSVLRSLGIEPDQRKNAAKESNAFEWRLEFLDDDKKARILRLRNELEDKLALRQPGSLDARGIEQLRKEMEDSIRQLLTPEESLQYDLRMSATASSLRHQLQGFEPTEEEFVSLFKLRKGLDEELGVNSGNDSAAERARRQEAELQLKEQIKKALGAPRFADYELALEPGFQQMYIAVKQAGLGTEQARQVYAMKQAAEEQAARIRSDQALAASQRGTELERIRQESERSIQALMGENGWQQFRQGPGARWLNRLTKASAGPSQP